MKTRNVDLEHSPILTNHVCKHIILEAPTALELEKKVKEYKLMLARALTNAYKLSSLSLENDGAYHISPNGSYQSSIFMTFAGKKKEEISNPEKTLQYVKHLTSLESKKNHESNIIRVSNTLMKESSHTDTITVEVDEDLKIDEVVSNKQKDLLEKLILNTNLVQISFLTTFKHKDSDTGKTIITLSVCYKCREIPIKKVEQTDSEEPGNR